jgi:phage gp29-like protein
MGFWSRLFSPSPAVVADVKALPPPRLEQALALRDAPPHELVPVETDVIIQPGSQMWRTYPADDIDPTSYKNLRRLADLGHTSRLMELYDDIASDYQVGSQLRTRKLAVAGAPVESQPGDKSPTGKKIADDFLVFWDRIPNRVQLLSDILDDFFRGFSCNRPIWDSIDSKWWICGHEAIESRYFYFENATTPLICPIPGGAIGVPVPEGYIYSEARDKAGPVVRAGAGPSVGKMWIAKGYALVDTSSYLEQFGKPHVQVNMSKTLREGDPELERIKDAARSFVRDQIGLMPAGATLAVMDQINKAATVRDTYLAFIDFCDMAISKAIVGQVLTADAGPGGIGHGGAAKEQGDVRQDLKEADAARLEGVLMRTIVRPWTLYHYGPMAPVPTLKIDVAKPEDRVQATLAEKQRAETINILRSAGMRIKALQQYNEFGLDKPADVDETTELALPTAPPQATDIGDPAGGVPAPGGKKPPKPAK